MVQVIDNLLPELYLKKLNHLLLGNSNTVKPLFNWFWNDYSVSDILEDGSRKPKDNNFMLTHVIWNEETNSQSPHFEIFLPIVYFINQHCSLENIIRIKLNCYPNQGVRKDHAKHNDIRNPHTKKPLENCKITVLNLTTCNGGTIIDDKEYSSIKNQALIFDNNKEHSGFTQTDTSRRIVINIATTN